MALVIGEAPLADPVTDAAAVAEALKDASKLEHSLKNDPGLDHFRLSLYRMLHETEGAEIILFTYVDIASDQIRITLTDRGEIQLDLRTPRIVFRTSRGQIMTF